MATASVVRPQFGIRTHKPAPSHLSNTVLHRALGNRQASFCKPVVQAKLEVGAPNDKYELEADREADRVMRMPAFSKQSNGMAGTNKQVQRKCAACKQEDEEVLRRKPGAGNFSAPEVSAPESPVLSGGCSLDSATSNFFESRFGVDFSSVRIHTGAHANNMNRALNARAFTYGGNIAFADGEYQPHSYDGRKLIAHELTHVIQQRNRPEPVIHRQERDDETARGRRFASRQPPGAQREDTSRHLTGEAEQSCSYYSLVGVQHRGRLYGIDLAEATDQVQMHNTDPVPDDWDGQPAYRRRFIQFVEGTPRGQWRVEPPRIELDNPDELRCFIEGINQGLESYQRVVAIAEPLAQVLNLVALALTIRGLTTSGRMMLGGRSPPPAEPVVTRGTGGRPSLELVHSSGRVEMRGGRVVAPRSRGSSVPRASAGSGGPAAAVAQAPEPVEAPAEPHLRQVPNAPPEAASPTIASGTVTPPVRAPVPQPAQTRRPGRRRRVGRCEIEPIPPLGGDPLSGLYCGAVTGGSRSFRITLLGADDRPTGRWAEIDSLRGNTWYECKCGYEALLSGAARGEGVARSILADMDRQILNHLTIATECGLQYRFIVSNDYVRDILLQRWFGNVTVDVREWEPCD